jgi:hypothetical protein
MAAVHLLWRHSSLSPCPSLSPSVVRGPAAPRLPPPCLLLGRQKQAIACALLHNEPQVATARPRALQATAATQRAAGRPSPSPGSSIPSRPVVHPFLPMAGSTMATASVFHEDGQRCKTR